MKEGFVVLLVLRFETDTVILMFSFLPVDLNGANIEHDVTDWWKSSYRLSKSLDDEFPAAAKCAAQLREDTTAFRQHLPVIQVWNPITTNSGCTMGVPPSLRA